MVNGRPMKCIVVISIDESEVNRMVKMTLEAARRNVGLSQKEAAIKLGVSNKTLGSWENGKSYPTADKINAMCELYGVGYDNLNFLPNNPL